MSIQLSRLAFFGLCLCLAISCSEPPEQAAAPTPPPAEAPQKVMTVSMPTIDSTITIEDLMGKIDPKKHPAFMPIEARYASRKNMYLRKEAHAAFARMHAAAKADGINLKIISATRPFAHQKRIWEAKWNGQRKVDGQNLSKTIPDPAKRALKILEYSSMPGTSRHHWGTDIDLNSLENSYFSKGLGKKIYDWLSTNAAQYGFCQSYSPKGPERPNGYEEEKWHWTYLPIARRLTEQYKLRITNEQIGGFDGAESATSIRVIENYVLGINQSCL